jgi:hypothetical protein
MNDFFECVCSQITVNRNSAKIIVGHSSKLLAIIIYPQVTEQWVIGNFQFIPFFFINFFRFRFN